MTDTPPTPPPYPPSLVFVPALRTSTAAVASLVMGLLGLFGGWCLCGVPCLLAVVFGHVGVARTRSGELAGHGLAVAGLILGYLFMLPAIAVTVLLATNRTGLFDYLGGLSG